MNDLSEHKFWQVVKEESPRRGGRNSLGTRTLTYILLYYILWVTTDENGGGAQMVGRSWMRGLGALLYSGCRSLAKSICESVECLVVLVFFTWLSLISGYFAPGEQKKTN